MSAVAEEKFGSSSVQRESVPAGTRMSCALVLACTPKNNTETAKYKRNRRMCATSRFEGQAERARNARTHGDAELEDEREEYTAGTHPFFAPLFAPRKFFEERRRKLLL